MNDITLDTALNLEAGDILKIWKFPVFHYGIFDGVNVIHASKEFKHICSESLHDFLKGQKPIVIEKKFTSYERQNAINFAHAKIGTEYSLINNNCEHFVNDCYGKKYSTQLAVGGFSLALGIFLLATKK